MHQMLLAVYLSTCMQSSIIFIDKKPALEEQAFSFSNYNKTNIVNRISRKTMLNMKCRYMALIVLFLRKIYPY